MGFLKQFSKNEIVFIIDDEVLKDSLVKKIIKNADPKCRVALDMKNVRTIDSDLFIKSLIDQKFKLYNVQNEPLTYLSIIIKDGQLRSYMNFNDFKENKRELMRRRFFVA